MTHTNDTTPGGVPSLAEALERELPQYRAHYYAGAARATAKRTIDVCDRIDEHLVQIEQLVEFVATNQAGLSDVIAFRVDLIGAAVDDIRDMNQAVADIPLTALLSDGGAS